MQRENWASIKLRELNQRLGSLDDFYNRLSLKGFYLPDRQKGCITAEYLFGVLTDKYFAIKREKIRVGFPMIKATKIDLYGYLQEAIKPNELGFKMTSLPNREWMETVLFSIVPGHLVFKKPEMLIPERQYDIPEWF